MEVHTHTHTSRKKWSHYFWEFFMLFLAVTAGFFVENQREHMLEHKREKQYMRSMIKDLEQDISNIQKRINGEDRTVQIADSLIILLRGNNYKNKTGIIYYKARDFATYPFLFYMTDGTLMQLKNSGGLRLIRKQQVVDSLQGYDNLYQWFKMSREREVAQLDDYRSGMMQIFDVQVFNSMIKSYPEIIMPVGNPPLLNSNPSLINEFLMRAHFAKRNKLTNRNALIGLKEKATKLITQIKKEYHLK